MLAVQAILIYVVGLTISLPTRDVSRVSAPLAAQLRQEWPSMRGAVLKTIKPLMRQEVQRMVSEITVDVGGVPIALPSSLQRELSTKIDGLLSKNLNQYFGRQFNPEQVLTPAFVNRALTKPITVHLRLRLLNLPVPVTVHMGGT